MQKIFTDAALRAVRSPCPSQVVKCARNFHLPPLPSATKDNTSRESTKQSENTVVAEESFADIAPLATKREDELSGNNFASQLEALYQARKAARLEEQAKQAAITETSGAIDKPLDDGKAHYPKSLQNDADASLGDDDRGSVFKRVEPRKYIAKNNKEIVQDTKTDGLSDPIRELKRMMSAYRQSMAQAKTKKLKNIIIQDTPARHNGIIRIISLARSNAHNALSVDLIQELKDEISLIHAEGDKGPTRCVVLASTSLVTFCAGADLKERLNMTTEAVQEFLSTLRETFRLIFNLPVPCIAAVNGKAIGGGAELAMCAHLRVLGANAMFCLPETGLGIIPGAGGTYRLPDIIGHPKALEMILTRTKISAKTADKWGLGKYTSREQRVENEMGLDAAGSHEACLARSVSMALAITNGAPLAVRAAIQAMVRKDRPRGEVEENMAYDSLLETSDRKEALQAFAEKRFAVFKGE